jgi:hypothetical protein
MTHVHYADHHTNTLLLHISEKLKAAHPEDHTLHDLHEAAEHEHARHAAAHAAMHPQDHAAEMAAVTAAALVEGGL